MKVYDPEENFEINLEMAYQVDGLHYKGVKTQYLEDTNTLIFSRDKEYLNDDDDLDTIIYRNYTVDEVKQHIDYNFAKMLYDEIDKMYSGYPTEEIYRKNLVNIINKTKYDNMKSVCSKLGYALSPYDLIRITNKYKEGNKEFNKKAEYLLTDLNFHSECSLLAFGKEDEVIEQSKIRIQGILKKYVLNKFVNLYKIIPETKGYISTKSPELNDVSEYDLKYLHYEGYLKPNLDGYELTDEYAKEIDSKAKKYKYVHWLKIDLSNETREGREWSILKEYKEKYDCNMTVFYYDNNPLTEKVIKLDCNQNYNDLDLDVNSMNDGSLIRLKSRPKNITQYGKDINYFFDKKIKQDSMEL